MSLILHYKFDQSDPTIDSSGNASNLTNVGSVVAATDPTYGTVAYFDGTQTSYLTLPTTPSAMRGSSPRTISYWLSRPVLEQSMIYNNGDTAETRFGGYLFPNDTRYAHISGNGVTIIYDGVSGSFGLNTWYNFTVTYDGTTKILYVGGVQVGTLTTTLATGSEELTIGRNNIFPTLPFNGSISDFRVYDGALSAADVSQIFSDGPNGANAVFLNVTPFTHLVDLDWNDISGATTYDLKFIKDGGNEESLATTTGLSYVANNLVPGSSYEFRVYSDIDLVTPFVTETVSTPVVDSTSVASLLTRLGNNLTLLSDTSLGDIDSLLETVLTTGETVITEVGSTTFVKNSETLTLPEAFKTQVLTSFDQASGAGQTVSILLPDTSTSVINYDESTDEVSVGGTSYPIGTSFILGGQKVTPKDI